MRRSWFLGALVGLCWVVLQLGSDSRGADLWIDVAFGVVLVWGIGNHDRSADPGDRRASRMLAGGLLVAGLFFLTSSIFAASVVGALAALPIFLVGAFFLLEDVIWL